MNPRTDQLQLNVGFIAQQGIGYIRNFTFDFTNITFPPDLVTRNFKGKLEVSKTSEGLLLQGKFQALIATTCSRCLCDFDLTLKTDFTELYTFKSYSEEDTELVYHEDGQIDMGPFVREYLLLEVPINPVCVSDCKGLCPICGSNLNQGSCDHDPDPIDPRMMVLKNLLDTEDT